MSTVYQSERVRWMQHLLSWRSLSAQDPDSIALGATDANAIALPGPPAGHAPGMKFTPAAVFGGARSGMVFKSGAQGTGYYPDSGLLGSSTQLPAAADTTGDTLALLTAPFCTCPRLCLALRVCAL